MMIMTRVHIVVYVHFIRTYKIYLVIKLVGVCSVVIIMSIVDCYKKKYVTLCYIVCKPFTTITTIDASSKKKLPITTPNSIYSFSSSFPHPIDYAPQFILCEPAAS